MTHAALRAPRRAQWIGKLRTCFEAYNWFDLCNVDCKIMLIKPDCICGFYLWCGVVCIPDSASLCLYPSVVLARVDFKCLFQGNHFRGGANVS